MYRRIAGPVVFVCVVLFGATIASAQVSVKAPLPFEFSVAGANCPAGTYAFNQDNPAHKMSVRGDRGTCALVNVSPFPPKGLSEKDATWLIFHHYGDKYFLAEIWSHRIGRQFPESEEEKKLRESGKEENNVRVAVK